LGQLVKAKGSAARPRAKRVADRVRTLLKCMIAEKERMD
jgi:hypothetical protein